MRIEFDAIVLGVHQDFEYGKHGSGEGREWNYDLNKPETTIKFQPAEGADVRLKDIDDFSITFSGDTIADQVQRGKKVRVVIDIEE